eukprot:GHVH01001139.1.p1 GENE.GHVH01001139.1~~GHVH01001139.1.p1  ORF type:complete len:163 (+),score=17.53 GHVH01001139.1:212-700(+)
MYFTRSKLINEEVPEVCYRLTNVSKSGPEALVTCSSSEFGGASDESFYELVERSGKDYEYPTIDRAVLLPQPPEHRSLSEEELENTIMMDEQRVCNDLDRSPRGGSEEKPKLLRYLESQVLRTCARGGAYNNLFISIESEIVSTALSTVILSVLAGDCLQPL